MGRFHGHSSTAEPGRVSTGRDARRQERTGRDDQVRQRWAVAACERCGRSAVLGEPMAKMRLYDRDVLVCHDCLDAAPPRATWVAAPDRGGRVPVPLVKRPGLRPAVTPVEPPDERAA